MENRLLTEMVMNLRDAKRLYGVDSEAGLARQRGSVEGAAATSRAFNLGLARIVAVVR